MDRVSIPKQDPRSRVGNFEEVALNLTKEDAVREAKRCLQCKKPLCVAKCPVEIDIPAFLWKLTEGDFTGAADKIKEKNSLPSICGRVCPQETQCEGACVLGKKGKSVAIGALERFCGDWGREHKLDQVIARPQNKGKVAVVGSGPAGLGAASDLAKLGYKVTMFEALHTPGGVLRYGIPEFRLPKEIVQEEISYVKSLGVEVKTNCLIGQTLTLADLFNQGYQAVFVGTGAGLPSFLKIPGENLNGVYSANEFLTRVNLMKAYLFPEYDTPVNVGNKVAVVGGGNVAMDAARTAVRLGAKEVSIVYRRDKSAMPARLEEVENAEEEGIIFRTLSNPIEIAGDQDKKVKALVCQRMELGEADSSGRPRPRPIPDDYFSLELDTVIIAIGQGPNPVLLRDAKGLKLNSWGYIEVDPETMMTNIPGIFAAGDIVTGAATVIAALGDGRKAARAIDEYISKTSLSTSS